VSAPASLDEALDWLRKRFDAEAAEGVRVVYEFALSGDAGGVLSARIDDGRLDARPLPASDAALRLELSADDFFAILAGRANADMLFMEERIVCKGDLSLALKLRRFFRGHAGERAARP